MDQVLSKSTKSFLLYAKNGCPPSLGIESTNKSHKNCSLFNLGVIDDLLEKEITTAILFSRFSWYLEKDGFQNSYRVREGKTFQHFVAGSSTPYVNQVSEKLESMRVFIRELRLQGIRVLVVEPIPEMGWHIPNLKMHSIIFNKPMRTISRSGFEETTEKRFIKFVEPFIDDKGVIVVNTSDIFCDTDVCFGEREKNLLFYDDNHPSISASQKIVERVLNEL
jgi:hypothetical protein